MGKEMDKSYLSSQVKQIQSVVAELSQKLIDLPQECQERISPDLERIKSGLIEISNAADRVPIKVDQAERIAVEQPLDMHVPAAGLEETEQSASAEQVQELVESVLAQSSLNHPGVKRAVWLYKLSKTLNGFVYEWDLTSNQVSRSEEIVNILGCSLSDIACNSDGWLKRIHPADIEKVSSSIHRAIHEGREGFDLEYRVRHLDGHWVDIWDKAFIVRDADGNAKNMRGVSLDISSIKKLKHNFLVTSKAMAQANIALRKSQERLRVALSNAPIAVFQTDLDFHYNWFYSPVMGLSTEQFLGKRDDEIFPPESGGELVALKQEAVDRRAAVRRDIKMDAENDARVWTVSVEPIYNERQEMTGLIGACVDITQMRELEIHQTEQSFQLEVDQHLLNHHEQEFQKIAHNLHEGPIQRLAGLAFSIQLARQLYPSPEVTVVLEQIGSQVKDLVGELRGVTYELRPAGLARFGISKAIQYHAEEFLQKYPDLQIHLSLSKAGDQLPEKISLALYRIYQESMNNIVRHAKASEVSVSVNLDAHQVTMEIKDNGKGFPSHSDWVKHARQGHFGLVIMKDRAESIGGKVRVKSEQNHGTIVRVVLPREIKSSSGK